jgi:glycosyltransferase involved in cell wall biosynthesis
MIRMGRRRQYDLLFLYSEHPLHVLIDYTARARRRLFWCLDPAPHSDAVTTTASIYEISKRALIQRADKVVVACDALRKDVIRRYRVADSRVITSFHGVLDNLIHPDLAVAERDIDVLFFGRLESYKGIDILADAIRLVRSRSFPALRVTIAGSGKDRPSQALGATVISGYLPDRELATLVARARMVVMPYRDATGTQVPQTAFSYGTPVIATAVGCLPEYVTDEVDGLIVPPGQPERLAEAIERLLRNQPLWERLSAGARRSVRERFSNDRLVSQLLAQALG